MQLIGCDFSCSPSRRKPIVLALGTMAQGRVLLQSLQTFETLDTFGDWLARPGAWVGGFDLPFGLPRELVQALGWPTDWAACMDHYCGLACADIREQFAAFCNARPVGGKFAHRATDGPAGSSPSMKWVNPPVPRLCAGDPQRVALEAYPGLLAREVLGHRSYKSDDKAKQTPERLLARRELLSALERGQTRLNLRLVASHAWLNRLADDASGDALDATLCLLQAAWAAQQHAHGHEAYGLPPCDPLEGWIVTA
jgi:hypothetical protein